MTTSLTLFFTHGVSLHSWDQIGSFEREVAVYRRLQEHDVRVSFVTYHPGDQVYADRLPNIRILSHPWFRRAVGTYRRMMPLLHPAVFAGTDVIKTNQTSGAETALAVARFWSKPLIARCGYLWSYNTAQEFGEGSEEARYTRGVEAEVFRGAASVNVTTQTLAEHIHQNVSPDIAVNVVPNYVDTDLFQPTTGFQTYKYDLLFVGRIAPEKNLTGLIEAVAMLDGVTLALVGEGPLQPELASRSTHFAERVHWLGRVLNRDLPSLIHRSRVFVLPSLYEGHPKVLIEAMACGAAVLGTDVPGIRDLIRNGETGLVCGTDPVSLRSAIRRLLADAPLRHQLGSAARQYALKTFSLDRIVQQELAIIRQVTR